MQSMTFVKTFKEKFM